MYKITDENYLNIVRKLVTDPRSRISKGTNLQNIPSRGDGELVRRCFIPPDGYLFVGADLSQIEPRIMAHRMYTEYNDNSLRQIYLEDKDLYTQMAVLAFDLPEEYCRDKGWYDPVSKSGGTRVEGEEVPSTSFYPRKLIKQGVLAVSYQQKPAKFAADMGVSMDVADMFFENFGRAFPSFKQMVQDTIDFMKKNGYVQTIAGRKRRFPKYKPLVKQAEGNRSKLIKLYQERKKLLGQDGNPTKSKQKRFNEIQEKIKELRKPESQYKKIERESFNATIQGFGADIMKSITNKFAQIISDEKPKWILAATIHDEVILAIPKYDITIDTIELVQDVMCRTVKLSVPLKSDIVIMPRWMEEYSPEQWDFENCCPKI